MTHNALVEQARRWLKNTLHCAVVLCEKKALTANGEIPDVIGWVNQKSIVIEVKTSRADFFADKKKKIRDQNKTALGNWRFFLTPPGLIKPEEVPERWGLYEAHDGKAVKHAGGLEYRNAAKPPFESFVESEKAFLLSVLTKTAAQWSEVLVDAGNR